jgi:hypothetical protein
MQVLVVCRRRSEAFTEAEFAPLLDAEAEAVRVLYSKGVVRAVWSREDVPGACLLLEVESADAARAAMQAAPFFARNMVEAEYIPMRGYRGFGPRG